jgi:ankyrin repeat protein
VDELGRAPLHIAAAGGTSEGLKEMLRTGIDPNAQDDNGWTALHFAAQAGSVECVRALLAAGARVDLRDNHGNTPLFRAVFESRGDGSIITMLREAGADAHSTNGHGVSPVQLARSIGNYDVVQFFEDLLVRDTE